MLFTFAVFAVFAVNPVPSRAAPLMVETTVDGAVVDPVEGYRKGDVLYLSLGDLRRVFGGEQHWYAASGRVRWRLAGRSLEFRLDSKEAVLDDRKLVLDAAVLGRASRVFVPASVVALKEFAAFTLKDAELATDGEALAVSRRATLRGPVVLKEPSRTTLEFEVEGSWSHTARRVAADRYEVDIAGLYAPKERTHEVNDGLVASVTVQPFKTLVRVSIALAEPDPEWGVSTRDGKLVIELDRPAKSRREEGNRAAVSLAPEGGEGGRRPGEGAKTSVPPAVAAIPVAVAPTAISLSPDGGEGGRRPGEGAHSAVAVKPSPPPPPAPRRKRLIVVDPGHGGKDSGAIGFGGIYEKDVNLEVALELAAALRQDGFEVVLTRDSDEFIGLEERSTLANKKKADAFISVHCNSSKDRGLHGYEVYFMSENASDPWAAEVAAFENSVVALEAVKPQSAAAAVLHDLARLEFLNEASALSGLIARELASRVQVRNRGVKQAEFFVLRGTLAPAVLIEAGFLTNPKEKERLTSRAFRKGFAEGLAQALGQYVRLKDGATVSR